MLLPSLPAQAPELVRLRTWIVLNEGKTEAIFSAASPEVRLQVLVESARGKSRKTGLMLLANAISEVVAHPTVGGSDPSRRWPVNCHLN